MRVTMRRIVLMLGVTSSLISRGQDAGTTKDNFKLSGYVDFYYSYFSDSVGENGYEKFATVSARTNSLGLNVAQLSASYNSDKVRAEATLHYGDIALSSWSTDFNFIQKAYIGYKLSEKIWLDAGFFGTHIGTEVLLPKDNFFSTLAIGTFHEPYYQSGLRASFALSEKFSCSFHILNGYNIFIDNNKFKTIGTDFKYTPSAKISMYYSNLIGRELNSGLSQDTRFYNNLSLTFTPTERISVVAGGDYGIEGSSTMYSGILSSKYSFSNNFALMARGEVFSDPEGFLSGMFDTTTGSQSGLKLRGISLGTEYRPSENSYVRLEARELKAASDLEIFELNKKSSSIRNEFTLTMGIWF